MKQYILLLSFFSQIAIAKVLFFTHAFNRPDFLTLQVKTFNALLEDEYELVVFNDAADPHMERQINAQCDALGLQHFRVPQHLHHRPGRHSAGHRHMDGIQFALDTIQYDVQGAYDYVVLIDSDAFLIKPFSIKKYMEGYDIAGKIEGRTDGSIRVRHLSPVLVFMNMKTLPNKQTLTFEGGYIHNLACDVGAHTYYYLTNNPTIRPYYFQAHRIFFMRSAIQCTACTNFTCPECVWHLIDKGFDDSMIQFVQECPDANMEFVLNHTFMHYRCGSNWDNKPAEYHQRKTQALYNFIDNVIVNPPTILR